MSLRCKVTLYSCFEGNLITAVTVIISSLSGVLLFVSSACVNLPRPADIWANQADKNDESACVMEPVCVCVRVCVCVCACVRLQPLVCGLYVCVCLCLQAFMQMVMFCVCVLTCVLEHIFK